MTPRTLFLAFFLVNFMTIAVAKALGDEPLAVIVNKRNGVDNVTLDELRKVCVQERKHWDDNTRVTVVLRDPSQPEREAVLQSIYRMSETDFNRYFLQAEFVGDVQTAPKHLSTASGVRRFIFNVPGAIGFVRASETDNTVKIVRVNGYDLRDPHYPLHLTSR